VVLDTKLRVFGVTLGLGLELAALLSVGLEITLGFMMPAEALLLLPAVA